MWSIFVTLAVMKIFWREFLGICFPAFSAEGPSKLDFFNTFWKTLKIHGDFWKYFSSTFGVWVFKNGLTLNFRKELFFWIWEYQKSGKYFLFFRLYKKTKIFLKDILRLFDIQEINFAEPSELKPLELIKILKKTLQFLKNFGNIFFLNFWKYFIFFKPLSKIGIGIGPWMWRDPFFELS